MNDSDEFRIHNIVERVRSDDVILDVGCARHDTERRRRGNLHDELVRKADRVVGIDRVEDEIRAMSENGYDVVIGDAERLDELHVDAEFDVVVAGELIEHLSNPGLFLDGARSIIGSEGRLLLSTPNPHAIVYTKKAILGQDNNVEHTCWFDEQFIKQLADRHGWTLADLSYRPPTGGLSRLAWSLSQRLGGPGFVAEFHRQA